MKLIKYALTLIAVAFIASCTARYTPVVNNVYNAPVVTNGKHITQEQVSQAIDKSGKALGWEMKHVRPGYTIATLHIRSHIAKVGIHYSANTYSIRYLSSVNLTRKGMVHRNYNGWVQNLNNTIRSNISDL